MIRRCLLVGGLVIGACRPGADRLDTGPAASIETTAFARSLEVDLTAMKTTASGLFYRDLTEGSGPEVRPGQLVSVHYLGSFPDGKPFDRNMGSDVPFRFRVGHGEVIPGWDEGVAGMRVGGRRQLILPGHLGYGAAGSGPIPPDATLVFLVEVVAAE